MTLIIDNRIFEKLIRAINIWADANIYPLFIWNHDYEGVIPITFGEHISKTKFNNTIESGSDLFHKNII